MVPAISPVTAYDASATVPTVAGSRVSRSSSSERVAPDVPAGYGVPRRIMVTVPSGDTTTVGFWSCAYSGLFAVRVVSASSAPFTCASRPAVELTTMT